jgi:hypothetical protein
MASSKVMRAVISAAVLLLPGAANAADIRTFAFAYRGTYINDTDVQSEILEGSTSNLVSTGTAESLLYGGYQFDQPTADGVVPSFWSVTSHAIGGSGVLKALVFSGVTNALNNSSLTEAQPNYLHGQAQTSFSDTFDVGGNAEFIQFQFQIDGQLFSYGDTTKTALVVFGDLENPYFAPDGYSNETLLTKILPVINGHVDLSLVMDASVTHDLRLASGSAEDFGSVSFLNTLKLTKVQGFADAAGQQAATINSLRGADGFNYASIATGVVPEPASWAMMVGGLGLVGFSARRRRPTVRVTFA